MSVGNFKNIIKNDNKRTSIAEGGAKNALLEY